MSGSQLDNEIIDLLEKLSKIETRASLVVKAAFRNMLRNELAAAETPFDPTDVQHGLYEIFWKSGGSSLASVGSYSDGRRWFAATNWVRGESDDWSGVDHVELVRGH